jgi:hypothetical protein
MPLGRGLMNVGRFTIYQTNTTINSISPGSAICGDTVTFNITVGNNTLDGPIPTGTVSIVNINSGTVLATNSLISGIVAIAVSPTISMGKYVAIYNGVHNSFEDSISSVVNYNVSANNTITTVLTPDDLYFCYSDLVNISANVSPTTGPFPLGSVRFRLYSDNIYFIELSPGALDGYGNATSIIPSNTTTDGYDYWLQALYDGYHCWNSSESPFGMFGTTLHSTTFNTTTTISGANSFCINSDAIFNVVVASTSIGTITGSIIFKVLNFDETGPTLGPFDVDGPNTGVTIPVTIPHNSLGVRIGEDHLISTFTPKDGSCYNGSVSNKFDVTVLEC